VEAAMQASKGLEILTTLPDSPWRRQQELDLHLSLGWSLMATKGFSATEAVETLARAQALAEQLNRPEHLVPLMVSQWTVHLARAEHRLAVSLGKQIEDIGEARNDVAVQILGRQVQGMSRFWLGELVPASALLEELADPAQNHPVLPWDSRFHVVRLVFAGQTMAFLGHIDRARSRTSEALSLARQIRSGPTLAQVFIFANFLDYFSASPLMHTEELLALSTEQKLPQWVAWGLAFRGLALGESGQAQEAFTLLNQALAQLRTIRAMLGVPVLLAWLARVSAMLGRSAEAWRYIAEAA